MESKMKRTATTYLPEEARVVLAEVEVAGEANDHDGVDVATEIQPLESICTDGIGATYPFVPPARSPTLYASTAVFT
jgi:hypothetical protein